MLVLSIGEEILGRVLNAGVAMLINFSKR
jgi:hypothetical protein